MATVTASYNWVSGETVTPAKLNTTAAPTVVVADDEVTTAKILDANVTNAKLASGIDASKLTTGTLPIARIADAAVTPAKLSQPLTLATAQNTTSGTSIDFTGIPSWVRRITVMLNGVSTNGTSLLLVRLGTSAGVATSNYSSSSANIFPGSFSTTGSVSGFVIDGAASQHTRRGHIIITDFGNNNWVASHTISSTDSNASHYGGGSVSISGALDRIRLTTVNGTDAFDAGSVNIMYEG